MLITTTYDIHTQQPVYAICNAQHQCGLITTNILTAIQAGQCKNFQEVKTLIQK